MTTAFSTIPIVGTTSITDAAAAPTAAPSTTATSTSAASPATPTASTGVSIVETTATPDFDDIDLPPLDDDGGGSHGCEWEFDNCYEEGTYSLAPYLDTATGQPEQYRLCLRHYVVWIERIADILGQSICRREHVPQSVLQEQVLGMIKDWKHPAGAPLEEVPFPTVLYRRYGNRTVDINPYCSEMIDGGATEAGTASADAAEAGTAPAGADTDVEATDATDANSDTSTSSDTTDATVTPFDDLETVNPNRRMGYNEAVFAAVTRKIDEFTDKHDITVTASAHFDTRTRTRNLRWYSSLYELIQSAVLEGTHSTKQALEAIEALDIDAMVNAIADARDDSLRQRAIPDGTDELMRYIKHEVWRLEKEKRQRARAEREMQDGASGEDADDDGGASGDGTASEGADGDA